MALYDYKCKSCNDVTTVEHSVHDTPTYVCDKCGNTRAKLYSAPVIQFRGNGWGHQ